jgi:cephalosporin hydroxylase
MLAGRLSILANLLDLEGRGKVVTIDIRDQPGKPRHPRIHYILGSSTSPETLQKVKSLIGPGDRVMVVLDSDHSKAHVLEEMRVYGPLVTKDCYLIVEDTNINGHPVFRDFGPGPMEAVEGFLTENADFIPDRSREKFLLTHNPKGYLRRAR